jgi:hypothetical protein
MIDIQNYPQPYNSYYTVRKKTRLQFVALAILMLNTLKNLQSLTIDMFVLGTYKQVQRLIFCTNGC